MRWLRILSSSILTCLVSPSLAQDWSFSERGYILEVVHRSTIPEVKSATSYVLANFFAADEFYFAHEFASDIFSGLSIRCQSVNPTLPWSAVEESLANIAGASRVWDAVSYHHQRSIDISSGHLKLTRNGEENMKQASFSRDTEAMINAVHDVTQVSKLHALSLSGEGIRIALVDGGVDYLHPALGGGFGPGFKIDYGWDFVGDNVRPPLRENPDDDPFGECSDHATHTAGILFGNDSSTGFRGVAPGASIELYRVFDCNGMSATDVVVRAVLKAYERGVDLINLSLGSGSRPFSDDPLASLVSRINRAGPTFIVTGAGNSGRDGTFSAAAPEGGGPDVFSVGAVDIAQTYSVLHPVRLLVNGEISRQNLTWNGPTWTAGWHSDFPQLIQLIGLNESESPHDGCQEMIPPYPGAFMDKAVLMRRGGCPFKTKLEHLVRAGGQYTLIYNDREGPVFDLEVRVEGITGAGSLDAETGAKLSALLRAGNQLFLEMDSNFTLPPVITSKPNTETADRASTFSTWGPSGEGHLVTTLLAPGGRILSTLPRLRGGWGIQSGSSMAVPYVTGCLALLKEAFPERSLRELGKLLANTAVPIPFSDGTNTTYGFLASTWQQGAGRVDAFKAFQTKTTINVTSLAFNDTEFLSNSQAFTVSNMGDSPVTYQISHEPAVTVLSLLDDDPHGLRVIPRFSSGQKEATATPQFLETLRPEIHADIQISVRTISLQPGESATIDTSPRISNLASLAGRCPLYSGYVRLQSDNPLAQSDLVVPYGGIACQARSIPTLLGAKNTTFLAAATRERASTANFESRFQGAQSLQAAAPGTIFGFSELEDSEDPGAYASMILPTLQVTLSMYTRAIKFDLLPQPENGLHQTTEESIPLFGSAVMFPVGGFGRIETVFQHWTGILPNGSWASPGRYRIRIAVLRLYGDVMNEADFKDEFTTEHFYITGTEPQRVTSTHQEMVQMAEISANLGHCSEHTLVM